MVLRSFPIRAGLLLAALLLPLACGDSFGVGTDGQDVGGPCAGPEDCGPDSFCVSDTGDFPGGSCAMNCDSHADCPDGSFCISTKGGICVLGCDTADDCRAGYDCESKSDQDGGGESKVCID
ncbi:MAG: hypothetical protein R3B72_19780 [Polyangiaceae bacterium]